MEIEQLRVIAGTVSSLMFVAGNLPMLIKAFATKDLGSYSLESIALSNSGNLIHWLYVSSLPFGPIWFFAWFLHHHDRPDAHLVLAFRKGLESFHLGGWTEHSTESGKGPWSAVRLTHSGTHMAYKHLRLQGV